MFPSEFCELFWSFFCITAPVGCFCYYLQFILIVFNILLSKENAFKVRNGNVKIYFIKNKQKILSIIILISTSNITLIILKVNKFIEYHTPWKVYSEFLWSIFSSNEEKGGADNFEYGHFSRSAKEVYKTLSNTLTKPFQKIVKKYMYDKKLCHRHHRCLTGL